jgi:hypothetical protein
VLDDLGVDHVDDDLLLQVRVQRVDRIAADLDLAGVGDVDLLGRRDAQDRLVDHHVLVVRVFDRHVADADVLRDDLGGHQFALLEVFEERGTSGGGIGPAR